MSLLKNFIPHVSAITIGTWGINKFFNRSPYRRIPPKGMVSPADGKVYHVSPDQIKIVIRLRDVHMIRAPLAGKIKSITAVPGKTNPCIEKCPVDNRYRRITISTKSGDIHVDLIHGAITKRIDIFVEPDEVVEKGARIGHIMLGSGCNTTIPRGYTPTVKPGDIVYAGSSIIATKQSTR